MAISKTVYGGEIELLKKLRHDLGFEPVSDEEIIKEDEVNKVLETYFKRIGEQFATHYLPGQLNRIYFKVADKDHPGFTAFTAYSSTFFG
ncbi:MAG: hypothetical protein WC564_02130 [Patescibacteria group bacterium]|jgi:hypothetical protein